LHDYLYVLSAGGWMSFRLAEPVITTVFIRIALVARAQIKKEYNGIRE